MGDVAIANHGQTKSHTADEALAANRFVKLVTGTGEIPHIVYADAGDLAVGVNRDDKDSGQLCDVVYGGIVKVLADENFTAGAVVAAANDGKAKVAASGNYSLGQALNDCNSGDFVKVRLGAAIAKA